MVLRPGVRVDLEKSSNYYERVACYLRCGAESCESSESLPKEFQGSFKEVECKYIKELINDNVLKDEVVICNNRLNTCIHVSGNAEVCLMEVTGREVILVVDEAYSVDVGDLIAYTVTGKGEVRNSYSRCKGYIVLIEEFIGRPQGYRVYVAGGDHVRRIR